MTWAKSVARRGLAVVGFAAVAGWALAATAVGLIRSRTWADAAFVAVFGLLTAAPFALAAYHCYRRRDRDLFMVGAAVASFALLSLLLAVPRQLGVTDILRGWLDGTPWEPLISLAVLLVMLLGPFVVTARFYRACSRFAVRRLRDGNPELPREPA